MNIQYVRTLFRKTIIVFHSYENGPSINDEAHDIRMGGLMGADVDQTLNFDSQCYKLQKSLSIPSPDSTPS